MDKSVELSCGAAHVSSAGLLADFAIVGISPEAEEPAQCRLAAVTGAAARKALAARA